MPKRTSSSLDSSAIDNETVPQTPSSPEFMDDETKPTTPQAQNKKQKKSPSKGDQVKSPKRVWTPEEDLVFLEVIEKMISNGLWQAIKQDGRLEYRGNSGIKAHYLALFKNLKKNGVSGGGEKDKI